MHLGSRVSALLDGRLPLAEEERAWSHVHECHPCRDLVEREGWIKTRLAGLSFSARPEGEAPDRLKDALLGCVSALAPEPFPTATTVRARHRSLVMIGGGAAGAAVMGVLALGAAGTPHLDRRAPVTNLSRPSPTATPVVNDLPAAPAKKRKAKQRRQEAAEWAAAPQVVVLREAPQATMVP